MKTYALCAVAAGADILRLLHGRVPLTGVIGLADRDPGDAISGYVPMAPVAESLGLPFHALRTYAMTGDEDRALLERLDIDLLIVCGWQRLVPGWLIDRCRLGGLGAHGSPAGIAGGRGRSPQNWALIAGAPSFRLALFFLDPGVDSGPVIAERSFLLDPRDDIASSYLKVTVCLAEMIVEAWEDGAIAARKATPQAAGGFYLPQRTAEDGRIDWSRSAQDIARFVAALSHPYPGALTEAEGVHLKIWRARPFSASSGDLRGLPGRVVLHALSGALLVETGDGLLLIDDFTAEGAAAGFPARGVRLASVDFRDQIAAIVARHVTKYPEMPVAPLVTDLLADPGGGR